MDIQDEERLIDVVQKSAVPLWDNQTIMRLFQDAVFSAFVVCTCTV